MSRKKTQRKLTPQPPRRGAVDWRYLAVGFVAALLLVSTCVPQNKWSRAEQAKPAVTVTAEVTERNTANAPAAAGTAVAAGTLYKVQTVPPPAVAGDLRIEGPAKAKVGQMVRLNLIGTPTVDVTKPLAEQLVWASSMQMRVLSAQEGATLDGSLVIVFPLALQLRLEFFTDKPGDYWIVVDWNYEKNQLLTHRITVEGEGPTPKPTPGPTPGPKYAVIVEESSQRTPQIASVIKSTGLRDWAASQGHVIRVVDKDAKVPADLEPYVRLVAGKSLPRLIVATMQGNILVEEDLPVDIETVKQKIGEK